MSDGLAIDHGPWVDVHSHPGCGFLEGLPSDAPVAKTFGGAASKDRVVDAASGEVAAVNASTVADLMVLGLTAAGPGAVREFEPGEAVADHRRQIRGVAQLIDRSDVTAVLAASDVFDAHDAGRPGVFLSCEGADFLDGQGEGLAEAYRDGVRAITLVHYRVNELGDIQTEDAFHGGLTPFGAEVVEEMNRLGMIVDLAHATFDATIAALEASKTPLMISHSHLASPGADHPRLLSEEHARVVADGGGIIGAWPSGVVSLTLGDYVEEICRLIEVVGIDHVAIGTDLDANYRPVLTNYSQFPEVAAQLDARGLGSAEIDKVLGGNFLRVFQAVEAAAG